MAEHNADENFPHSLTIDIPFPTHRLAKSALGTLAVDEELSGLVRREFRLVRPAVGNDEIDLAKPMATVSLGEDFKTILNVHYKATTARMLRVAVNSFFESLGVITQVMEELDIDVLHEKGIEGLEGVQGVEQGMTGSGVAV